MGWRLGDLVAGVFGASAHVSSSAVHGSTTLADLIERAAQSTGVCPACGYWNHPDSSVRDADDDLVYCSNCGGTWHASNPLGTVSS